MRIIVRQMDGSYGAKYYRSDSVKLILRFVLAILAGMLISVILNLAALEYVWNSHAANRRFAAVFFAPGSLLAGRGFEAQSSVVPLNLLAFAVVFSIASFLLLRVRRAVQ